MKKRKQVFIGLLALIIAFGMFAYTPYVNVEIHIIDLPTGDATLIKINQENILLGGGEDIQELMLYLNNQKITTLHKVILPQPLKTYSISYKEVIKQIKIENMYIYNPNEIDDITSDIIDRISETGGKIVEVPYLKKIKLKQGKITPYALKNDDRMRGDGLLFEIKLPGLFFVHIPQNGKIEKITNLADFKGLKGDIIKISEKVPGGYLDPIILKNISPNIIIFDNKSIITEKDKNLIKDAEISPQLLDTKTEGYIVIYRYKKDYMITSNRIINTKIL